MNQHLQLIDYRHRVETIYAAVRDSEPNDQTWLRWRTARDELFSSHSQSPIEDRERFTALPYFDHDPRWRALATLEPADEEPGDVGHSSSGATSFRRIGTLRFDLSGAEHTLDALWLDSYGGGLFVPFRDLTNGESTYGGGRYIVDTVKGADLGANGDEVVLDFNYSYHPSCVHSPRWSCPLAPPSNRLDLRVEAGERLATGEGPNR